MTNCKHKCVHYLVKTEYEVGKRIAYYQCGNCLYIDRVESNK